jgi:hypothetical protein
MRGRVGIMSQMTRVHAAGERLSYTRQWPRYPISAQAEAIEPLAGCRVRGLVTVIGQGGCYFRVVDTLKSGAILRVWIEWQGTIFNSWAKVSHAIGGDGMGLMFFDVQPEQMDLLKRWIERLAEV